MGRGRLAEQKARGKLAPRLSREVQTAAAEAAGLRAAAEDRAAVVGKVVGMVAAAMAAATKSAEAMVAAVMVIGSASIHRSNLGTIAFARDTRQHGCLVHQGQRLFSSTGCLLDLSLEGLIH